MRRLIVVSLGAAMLAGCSYGAKTSISPSYNVPSSYERKLSGDYAVKINAEAMREDVSVSGFTCSAHDYPLDMRSAFETSTVKTVQQVVDNAKLVQSPLTRADMKERNFKGLIRVEGRNVDTDLTVDQGFFSSDMKAEVQMVASINVDTPKGRALGTTVSAERDKKTGAGAACEGGAEAISGAAEDAMQALMRRIGEEISNSPRLREQISVVPRAN